MASKKVILGVDPGSNVTGYSIIISERSALQLVNIGHITMERYDNHFDKLSRIYHRIIGLIDEYKPHEIAVEAPFYGKNAQSMLKLGRAQGMAIAAALQSHIPVFEYSAKKVKLSVTGTGNASKEQVAAMLPHIVTGGDVNRLKEIIAKDHLDATDALAVAICHHMQATGVAMQSGKKYGSWSAYVKANPGKVK